MKNNIPKDKINNITDILEALKGLLKIINELWLIIVPLLTTLIALFNFEKLKNFLVTYHILSEGVINFIYNNSNGLISLLLLLTLFILIMTIRKTGKQEIQTGLTTYNLINKLHNDFIHKIRNAIYELHLLNEKIIKYRAEGNQDAIQEVHSHAIDNLSNNLQNFVNSIADYLSTYNNDTISVCIKTINPGQNDLEDFDKKAKTLVRSHNTDRERKRSNEDITIGKNTDFIYLCKGTNIWFHGVDLKSQYDNDKYFNEAEAKDWQSKYNSTIVVPIRYYNANDRKPINDILGFLCIDSKNIIHRWDDINSFELQYLAIYADTIYTYIKLFRKIFEEG